MTSKFVVCYDLTNSRPSPYSEFLDQAEKRGWSRWFWLASERHFYRLPNTTLVGDFNSRDEADKAFDEAVAATAKAIGVKVNVEKYFLTNYSGALIASDNKVKPKS